jgi:carbamoyltransferase
MLTLGVSAGFHDAGLAVVEDGEIVFAGHSERYSKKKHDKDLCEPIIKQALSYQEGYGKFDAIGFYETPWLKKTRELYAGQGMFGDRSSTWTTRGALNKQFTFDKKNHLPDSMIHTYRHHHTHAAAGFQTSPFNDATVVVIDAIGEWETISIWHAEYDEKMNAVYKKLWSQKYPHSIGLYYSALTHRLGLRPLDEEYIMMGMAGWGKPTHEKEIYDALLHDDSNGRFKDNLHIGVDKDFLKDVNEYDIAASAQAVVEKLIDNVMARARGFNKSRNLVYMGGVALNCLYNRGLGHFFDDIWIMPNPGDCGSALGAAALAYGSKLNWETPFLGTPIAGAYPTDALIDELQKNKIVGVASGKAEFGPRALGNRSLLADPRGAEIKDKVNEIKRRQKFRPFAPMILAEHVHEYFEMPPQMQTSPYMQVVAKCKKPDEFPAIIHVDGTSRVQTVDEYFPSGVRELLEKWYVLTGCPILLNTSLNIRGEPMVNDRADADRFEQAYGVKVCS